MNETPDYTTATSVRTQHSKLGAFISYSREDLDFADQLDVALRLWGFDTTLDRHAISGGEEWKRRLQTLIREADTVVFVLSPSSVNSSVCAWEVEEAVRLGKRIIPVVCSELPSTVSVPPRLQDLNYIFFYKEIKAPESGFGTGLAQLVQALNADLDWLREHTRLLLRATEWEAGGKPVNRLLSGSDITAAKAWALRRPKAAPEPTPLHLEFIRASEEAEDERLREQRKQLENMAIAQEERERALRRAEDALARTIKLKRRQAWAGTITIAVLAVIGWWSYGVVREQRAVGREAARVNIRGQIVAYAAAFGSEEMDVAEGYQTSPYTTPLVQKLRQKKNLVEAIVDAHQQVLDTSKGAQRPQISTSMNGQIYLHQQPATRLKRVLAISVDKPGVAEWSSLKAPPHDVDAFIATLVEAGFSPNDVITLRNPDRTEIELAIDNIKQSFRQRTSNEGDANLVGQQTKLIPIGFNSDPVRPEFSVRFAAPVTSAPDNGLFIFFFSGHGIHISDKDYIIPRLSPCIKTISGLKDIVDCGVSVTWLTQAAEEVAAASVVILDTHFPIVDER
jgi:TIR domain